MTTGFSWELYMCYKYWVTWKCFYKNLSSKIARAPCTYYIAILDCLFYLTKYDISLVYLTHFGDTLCNLRNHSPWLATAHCSIESSFILPPLHLWILYRNSNWMRILFAVICFQTIISIAILHISLEQCCQIVCNILWLSFHQNMGRCSKKCSRKPNKSVNITSMEIQSYSRFICFMETGHWINVGELRATLQRDIIW